MFANGDAVKLHRGAPVVVPVRRRRAHGVEPLGKRGLGNLAELFFAKLPRERAPAGPEIFESPRPPIAFGLFKSGIAGIARRVF